MSRTKPSAYSLALSDGSLRNGLLGPAEVKSALKESLLFFDEIFASAPALLRNHVLFDLHASKEDQESVRTVYKEYLRPVLLGPNENMVDVAEDVLSVDNPILSSDPARAFERDLIERHAEMIHGAKPRYFKPRTQVQHRLFYYGFDSAIERLAREGVPWWPKRVSQIGLRSYSRILKGRKGQALHDKFTVRNAYDLADTLLRGETHRFVKAFAFTLMEYVTSTREMRRFLTCSGASPMMDSIGQACGPYESGTGFAPADVAHGSWYVFSTPPTSFRYPLPLDKLASASLSDILRFRPYFAGLRKELFRISSTRTTVDDLQNASPTILDRAKADFESFLDAEDRGEWFRTESKKRRRHRINLEVKALCFEGCVAFLAFGLWSGVATLSNCYPEFKPLFEASSRWDTATAAYLAAQFLSVPGRIRQRIQIAAEHESRQSCRALAGADSHSTGE